jgi:hypothetical protein
MTRVYLDLSPTIRKSPRLIRRRAKDKSKIQPRLFAEGHHVRSCPLKKKPLSEKKQGKRPQAQTQVLFQDEEMPLNKKN